MNLPSIPTLPLGVYLGLMFATAVAAVFAVLAILAIRRDQRTDRMIARSHKSTAYQDPPTLDRSN